MLTNFQKEILTGLMLGDGCIYLPKKCINPKLIVGRSTNDLSYLKYQFSIFEKYIPSGIKHRKRYNKKYDKYYYSSVIESSCSEDFKEYYNNWYKNGVKIIPKNINITPYALATWFCDDGHIKIGKNSILVLATNGFKKQEIIFLRRKLKKTFRISVKIHICRYKGKKSWVIKIMNRKNIKLFYDIIRSYFPQGMERKLNIFKENEDLLIKSITKKKYPKCVLCKKSNKVIHRGTRSNNLRYFCKCCNKDFVIYQKGHPFKLTKKEVQKIISLYKEKKSSYIEISKLFNISKSMVGNIVNGNIPEYLL